MSIKSVLVSLQSAQNTSAVLDVAVGLARRHKAHLTGLHVTPSDSERSIAGSIDHTAALERAFRERAGEVQLSHEWCCMQGDAENVITLESRCHDILIIGQADPAVRSLWTGPHDRLETILIESGHPLIAVPYGRSCPTVGDRILIA